MNFDNTDPLINDDAVSMEAFELIDDKVAEYARKQQAQVDTALKQAILRDYDGVDVERKEFEPGIIEITPWTYPAPESNNGYRTTRFEWKWFDNEYLKMLVREDRGRVLFYW